jgi:hypothetical protein
LLHFRGLPFQQGERLPVGAVIARPPQSWQRWPALQSLCSTGSNRTWSR